MLKYIGMLAVLASGPGAMAASPLVLEGNFLKVGISTAGTFGSGGSASPGILHDPTGVRAFGVNDYLTPGSPHDGYTVAGNGFSGEVSNNSIGSSSFGEASPTLLTGAAALGFANAATWSGGNSRFNITNSYFFNNNDERIRIITTITALSDLTGVVFGRSIDPDPDVNTFGSFATRNQRGNSLFSAENFVGAAGPSTGLTLGLLNLNGAGITTNTQINGNCCNNANVFDVLAGVGGVGNTSFADHSLNMAFGLGDIAAGQSVTINYAYVFGEKIETVGGPGVVPEPASWAMLIMGFGLVGSMARRRRLSVVAC